MIRYQRAVLAAFRPLAKHLCNPPPIPCFKVHQVQSDATLGDLTMQRRTLLQSALLAAPYVTPFLAAPLIAPRLAHAQTYPAKSIRYVVPVSAGGGADTLGRNVTERWAKLLGQTFIVDNQAGGGGAIACQNVARAVPDGYTLIQGYVATHGTSPATRKLNYDAVKDFTPIGMIGGTANVLVVNAALPPKTIQEFIAYLKANPGKLSYGSAEKTQEKTQGSSLSLSSPATRVHRCFARVSVKSTPSSSS